MVDRELPLSELPGLTIYAYNMLTTAGFQTAGDVIDAPIVALDSLFTKRVTAKLLRLVGRDEDASVVDGTKEIVVYDNGQEVGRVTLAACQQIAGLRMVTAPFGFTTRTEVLEAIERGYRTVSGGRQIPFSWEDIARIKLQVASEDKRGQVLVPAKSGRRAVAEKEGEPAPASEAEPEPEIHEDTILPPLTAAEIDRQVQAELDQFAKDFDTDQWLPTDWADVRRLCGLIVLHNRINRALLGMEITADMGTARVLKEMQGQAIAMGKEIARMKQELGISMPSRSDKAKGQTPDQVITTLVANTKQLFAERAVIPQCPNGCGVGMGLFIPHFPRQTVTKELEFVCPRCGLKFAVPLVTDKMLAMQVDMQDFVPRDAPDGIFTNAAKANE